MNKDDLLKHLAEIGYNVGYGAKMSFASFDTLRIAPSFISCLSLIAGIVGVAYDSLPTKDISVVFLILGIVSLYISLKLSNKSKFKKSGIALTKTFQDISLFYAKIKSSEHITDSMVTELESFSAEANSNYISDQLFLASWLAHQKFFGEAQVQWIIDELNLTFWKDKVPSSLKVILYIAVSVCLITVATLFLSKHC